MMKGELKTPEYLEINPRGLVPSITEGDFKLSESATILRYLSVSRSTPDHWYPSDPKKRARVDELLDWNHTGLRKATMAVASVTFFSRLNTPTAEYDKSAFESANKTLCDQYQFIEDHLKKTKFVAGDTVSIADLQLAAEVEFHRIWKSDLAFFPKLQAWLEIMRDLPGYKESNQGFENFLQFSHSNFKW